MTTMMFQRTLKAIASAAKNMKEQKDKSKISTTDYIWFLIRCTTNNLKDQKDKKKIIIPVIYEVARIILYVLCVCVFIVELNSCVLTCNEVNQMSFNVIMNLQKQTR